MTKRNHYSIFLLVSLFYVQPLLAVIEIIVEKEAGLENTISKEPVAVGLYADTIDADFIESHGSDRIEDIVDYIPSVQTQWLGAGTDITIRGFRIGGRFLLDGIMDNESYYVRDLATVERVSFIKGSDSALYGVGSPGGTVNYIAKKPQRERASKWSMSVNNEGLYRITLDSTGLLINNDKWSYRNILALQHGGTWRENVNNNRYTWMPAIQYDYGRGYIYLAAELSQQEMPWGVDNVFAHGKPVYDVSYVHPGSKAKRKSARYTVHWSHEINSQWQINWKTNIFNVDRKETQINLGWMISDNQPLVGYYREENDDFGQLTTQLKMLGKLHLGDSLHNLTLGIGSHSTSQKYNQYRDWTTFVLDIYNPDFNVVLPTRDQLRHRKGEYIWHDKSIFIQDVITFANRWKIRLGARHIDYKLEHNTEEKQSGLSTGSTWVRSFGIEHMLTDAVTLYGGYNESILPNRGEDKNGNLFDPIWGRQKELGLVYTRPHYQLNFSVFDIKQTNLTTRSASDPDVREALGENHSKGLELSTIFDVNEDLRATIGYSYNNATIEKNNDGREGNKFPSIPRHSGSISLDYRPSNLWLFKFGAVYQDSRPGDAFNSFAIPSFTRYDILVRKQLSKEMSLSLSIENLTNIDYVTHSSGRDYLRLGRPRAITLSMSGSFGK